MMAKFMQAKQNAIAMNPAVAAEEEVEQEDGEEEECEEDEPAGDDEAPLSDVRICRLAGHCLQHKSIDRSSDIASAHRLTRYLTSPVLCHTSLTLCSRSLRKIPRGCCV
jgi:hypothetical protein